MHAFKSLPLYATLAFRAYIVREAQWHDTVVKVSYST